MNKTAYTRELMNKTKSLLTENTSLTELWNENSVKTLLTSYGQENVRFNQIAKNTGISEGKSGTVKFNILNGSKTLHLIFENKAKAIKALSDLSKSSLPYKFSNQFDILPTTIIVQLNK